MRRFVAAGLTLVAALALTAAPAQAQFFVGAGLVSPSGDFADGFKAGLGASAGVALFKSGDERFKVWAEGFFAKNDVDSDFIDGSSTMMGAFGSATLDLAAGGGTIPYIIGGAGYLSQKIDIDDIGDETEGGLGLFGGAGISFGKLWFEGRYTTASIADGTTAFLALMVGYSF
jgi:hypothetical protein